MNYDKVRKWQGQVQAMFLRGLIDQSSFFECELRFCLIFDNMVGKIQIPEEELEDHIQFIYTMIGWEALQS